MKKIIASLLLGTILITIGCVGYRVLRKAETDPAQKHPQLVIIGCSAAGFAAAKEMRRHDGRASVSCISEEAFHPYDKTKIHAYVSGKKGADALSLKPDSTSMVGVLVRGKVISFDRTKRRLKLMDGQVLPYDKLLLATGATPYAPPEIEALMPSPRINFYNSRSDIESIISFIAQHPAARVAILGAGIRALELADGLKARFANVSLALINRSARFLGESSDDGADALIRERLEARGVQVLAPVALHSLAQNGNEFRFAIDGGTTQSFDFLVVALGTTPNSGLAKDAGIEVLKNGAIKVDEYLTTSDPHIFAAGDVAGFSNPLGQGTIANAKWRAAEQQGETAAKNMVGRQQVYRHEPAAFITSFFGMKAVISGNTRQKPLAVSAINSDRNHYFRAVVENERLNAFVFLWDKKQPRPNIMQLRRALLKQRPVRAMDLVH